MLLNVSGSIDGTANSGVSVLSGPNYSYQPRAIITVAASGRITGAEGIRLGSSPGSFFQPAVVSLDNSGTITGTGGIAIRSTSDNYTGLSSVTNRAGGIIGAIAAPIGTLSNAGTIDGGARSAVQLPASPSFEVVEGPITNSGVIRNNSASATIANLGNGSTLTNSGGIVNAGAGAAVTVVSQQSSITNQTGGRIVAAGATAITVDQALNLTNRGTIQGGVQFASRTGFLYSSRIDSVGGAISGGLALGNGDDTLVARYDGTRTLLTGITGAINGGGGVDSVELTFAGNTGIATPIDLFTNFERLRLSAASGATITLANGFSAPGTLEMSGPGSFRIEAAIVTAGQAIVGYGTSVANFTNTGTIRTTSAQTSTQTALSLFLTGAFANEGVISSAGAGVNISASRGVTNAGEIAAAGIALSVSSSSFTNTGTIRSTGGAGLTTFGSVGTVASNSGRIEGVTGAQLSGYNLVNTGTIAGTALGVSLQSYGALDNRAGGTVTGGISLAGGYAFQATVANAGTINGDVRLVAQNSSGDTQNRFLALSGGVLNGNLTLGAGDLLVTDLNYTGPGRFAGITGQVTANGSDLRYRVAGDASVTLAPQASFRSVGFELAGGTLSLTGATTQTLTLAGTGVVDLSGEIATTNRPAIARGSVTSLPGQSYSPQTGGLQVTSRGTTSVERTDAGRYFPGAVALSGYYGGGDVDGFTNTGTITARDRTSASLGLIAVTGAASVANEGEILLDNALGVVQVGRLVNTGTIRQTDGGAAASGVYDVRELVNSGTISVGGRAVGSFSAASITNTGVIASTGGVAIGELGYGSVIENGAGGVISGRTAVTTQGATVINAGAITGTVDLGFSRFGPAYSPGAFVSAGGTVTGDVLFGEGDDLFLQLGEATGVTGAINGGDGYDLFGRALTASGTVAVGAPTGVNFEAELVQARGPDTIVTVTAVTPVEGALFLGGDGRIVNRATVNGRVSTETPFFYFYGDEPPAALALDLIPAEIRNEGVMAGGFEGRTRSLVNTGTIGSEGGENGAALYGSGDIAFDNSGMIIGTDGAVNVEADEAERVSIANSGSIMGGLFGEAFFAGGTPGAITLDNSGSIVAGDDTDAAVSLYANAFDGAGSLFLTNTGRISSAGPAGVQVSVEAEAGGGFAIVNAGRIEVNGAGFTDRYPVFTNTGALEEITAFTPARALSVYGGGVDGGTITNTGVIAATGADSVAVLTTRTALTLDNGGRIEGGAGTVRMPSDYPITVFDTLPYLAGAVQSLRTFNDTIRNTGAIIGSIDLGAGDDRIENRGLIDGAVFLRAGDDRYLQGAGGVLTGVVDGGDGADVVEIDAAGGGAVVGERFANFERLVQSGAGVVAYSGVFSAPTLELNGGGVRVEAGRSFATAGDVAVTGSDAAESLEAAGALAGAVALGGGDDLFAEVGEGRAAGSVDGGAGVDVYRVTLAGDRAGLSANTGFERLAADGAGTLSLTLAQGFEQVALNGVGLDVRLGGYAIGAVEGGAGGERLFVDGDVARVALGGGGDLLATGAAALAGAYEGGAGDDALRIAGAATLTGSVAGFEFIALGGPLTVRGVLGRAGEAASFGDGAQVLEVATGGRLLGAFDLGAGDDRLRLAAGAAIGGGVAGGAGSDRADLELAGDAALRAGALTGFELLNVSGPGTLTLTGGAFAFDRVEAAGDLRMAADAALSAAVRFGGGDNRFTIAGGYAGSVAGGAGVDLVEVSGGSAATPVAFGGIAEVEAFRMTGGYATLSGAGALGSADLSGGRLVGLAGSTMTASTFNVRQGATFGSAGTVNGDITVAGTLSPGASPGTMTVNGDVALQGASVSVFEITPTASDKLVVNGALSIANGATLQIAPTGRIQPGASLDLITASGGITGSFTNVVKPAATFGFLVQQANRIQLLGQFRNDPSFSGQVGSTIDYTNSVLVSGRADAALLAAAPGLVGANGASGAGAFALIAPEAYASARQAAVEQGLTLADAGRGSGFASRRAEPGLFTFGQFAADQRTLRAGEVRGTARVKFGGYGVFGGLGYAGEGWSLGGFAGYLDGRQRLDGRGAATQLDGAVFGVHGRADVGPFGVTATAAYAATGANTERALPGGSTRGSYDLTGLTLDVAATYEVAIGSDWALRPRIGGTVVRVKRDAVAETGSAAFAAQVAKDRDEAAFVDGALTVAGGLTPGAAVRPYATLGVRYQAAGRDARALAGFGGGGLGLVVEGAERARVLGTAQLGVEADLRPGVTLFSAIAAERGEDDRRESARVELRIGF